jgi:formylglycine-generating enzyme required for sulfatase activity
LDFCISVRVICLKPLQRFTFLALLGIIFSAHADHPAGDVVTMKNGDIYIGNVEQASFIVNASLGELTIPVPAIHRLSIQSKNLDILVETDAGEAIKGSLAPGDIRVSRLQDPTLPIALEDISRIDFGHQQEIDASAEFPSRLETTDGDLFFVRLSAENVNLETKNGPRDVNASDLRFVDTNLHTFEDELLTQLTLLDGRLYQGQMAPASILVHSPYLDAMNVPAGQLSRLTLDTDKQAEVAIELFSDSLRTLGNGPQMVKIKGGSFLRGDYQGDGDDDEQPLSEVNLKPYAIGAYEITFDQYDLFCSQTRKCHNPDDQEWGRGQRPAINISWEEASAYVDWLADKTGKPYRLPSDSEWEFAHRAGNTTRYTWGNEVESARANCEGCGSIWDGDQTAPVGRFEPNAFGLYDTSGNVFEWVADCFHDRFSEAPNDGSPVEKEGCGKRVIRGGAWSFPPHEIRSANRWRDFPTRRSDDTGFRIAMDLE